MKPARFLASALVCIGGLTGCTLMKVAPAIPEVLSGAFRYIALDVAFDEINKGNYGLAERELEKAERTNPSPTGRSEAAYLRAFMAERQGRTADAIEQYRGVVERFPNTPDSFLAQRKLKLLTPAGAP